MESPALTGPLLYLLIAWGIITAIFLVLLLWRSLLASHEDDQIFLDAAEDHMAREQRELVAKINSLSRPIVGTGVLAGVLLLGQARVVEKGHEPAGFAGCCCAGALAGAAGWLICTSDVWLCTMTQWLLRFSRTRVV